MNPDPIPRPRRQVPVAELFPGLSGRKQEGPARISVFESDDEEDARATPKINPNYVFHDTHETRRVLYAVEHPDTPCWLVGPTGCGKTTLIEQICARARRPLTRINMDANLARSDFLGIWVFKEDQSMSFHYGPASTAIRDGHVLVLDEIDVADPGVLLLFQACLEGRPFKVLETDETFPLHPDFRLFATANTVGRGDESLLYRAAQVQNFAFLDRFRWILPISYPTVEEETRVLLSRLEGALDAETCEKLAKTAAEIRRAHENEDCEAPISTRTLLDMAHDMLTFGGGHEAAFRYCFLGRLPRRDRELCERLIHAVWGSAGGNAAPKTPRARKSKKALLEAAKAGRLEEVRAQIEAGVELDGTKSGWDGKTALMLAAENGHVEVVRALLYAGAAVNAEDDEGKTALDYAEDNDESDAAELLLAAGAVRGERESEEEEYEDDEEDEEDDDGRTALTRAVENDLDEVKALLDAGEDVDEWDDHGDTALTLAALNGYAEIVQALLAAGADVNAKDGNDNTALTLAARGGYAELVQALLAAGADQDTRDGEGRTAQDYAEAWSTPAPSPIAPPSGDAEPFVNSIGMEFVPIPAGTFLMGSADDDDDADDDANPRHEVTISRAFHLGKYPVTQAQWRAVMGENPSNYKGPDRPVECVSWEDAQEFIKRLNAAEGHDHYRLPTEAEWEYACRAGSETKYSFGDDADELGNYAWYDDNSGGMTHPVGRKQPNAWGLHDMHGNVREWCEDWFGEYSAEAVVDPQGPGAGENRVLRGGGWCDCAGGCRAANRSWGWPGGRGWIIGFRLALSLGH